MPSKRLGGEKGVVGVVNVVILLATLMIGAIVYSQFANSVDPKLIADQVTESVTVNSTASLGPYSLTYSPIVRDTVTISLNGTIYVEGTDYTVDYTNGTFTVISGSSLATATSTAKQVSVTYKYEGGSSWNAFSNMKSTGWAAFNLYTIAAIVMAAGFILTLLYVWGRGGGGGV